MEFTLVASRVGVAMIDRATNEGIFTPYGVADTLARFVKKVKSLFTTYVCMTCRPSLANKVAAAMGYIVTEVLPQLYVKMRSDEVAVGKVEIRRPHQQAQSLVIDLPAFGLMTVVDGRKAGFAVAKLEEFGHVNPEVLRAAFAVINRPATARTDAKPRAGSVFVSVEFGEWCSPRVGLQDGCVVVRGFLDDDGTVSARYLLPTPDTPIEYVHTAVALFALQYPPFDGAIAAAGVYAVTMSHDWVTKVDETGYTKILGAPALARKCRDEKCVKEVVFGSKLVVRAEKCVTNVVVGQDRNVPRECLEVVETSAKFSKAFETAVAFLKES